MKKLKEANVLRMKIFSDSIKKNKFNNSGSKRFNNKKRPRLNGEFIEPAEDPMNGNLKRFAGIDDVRNEDNVNTDETSKPVALKLLEAYDEFGDNQSDDEPPEETAIIKKSALPDNKSLTEQLCSGSETVDKEVHSSPLVKNDGEAASTEVKIKSCSKVNEGCEKADPENGQKRKRAIKKESKPIKKTPPLRTPRTEIVERKGALLEALMGDLMRSERNAITQCICYIRNNMHRFCKIQAA